MALGEGDAWLDQGANILCFGPSGTGKSSSRDRDVASPARPRRRGKSNMIVAARPMKGSTATNDEPDCAGGARFFQAKELAMTQRTIGVDLAIRGEHVAQIFEDGRAVGRPLALPA